jgi:endoglucanase
MEMRGVPGKSCLSLLLALAGCSRAESLRATAPGTIVFQTNFDTQEDRNLWPSADFAQWTTDFNGTGSLRIAAPESEAKSVHLLRRTLDLTPYRGHQLLFRCVVRAKDVSKPPASYLGLKFMVHFESAAEGPTWKNENDVFGTFDRRVLQFALWIPDDASGGALSLGLQGSTGTAWFDSLSIVVLKAPLTHAIPAANAGPVFKGHDLPRLRGVMSPRDYDEESLRKLGEDWNANVIRWQLTCRGCGDAISKDTVAYAKWLDGKLLELDKVLASCRKHGLLVVVDLHFPPGGTNADKALAVFEDLKYQRLWISSWEKIARRYRGNPVVWGYDLVNEPLGLDADYLGGQVRVARAVRAIDSLVPIFVEATDLDSPTAYRELDTVPVPRVVYEVHMYLPGHFTHQRLAPSSGWKPIVYPGKFDGIYWDKNELRRQLQPVRDFQLAHNAHIYVGEFSAIRWAPGADRYLRDCIELFEEYGWDWTYHAYREWDGWNPELGTDPDDHKPTATPSERLKVLLEWFAKNKKPVVPSPAAVGTQP